MRFSLQDIKKSVQRRNGELTVSLHFLHNGALQSEIAHLIAYYESLLGQPQHAFSLDDARAYIGDYRLAHCLIATMSHWYSWRQRAWAEVLETYAPTSEFASITSPVQLRLALYDEVNACASGFLDSRTRTTILQQFATRYGLSVAKLEYLLKLDSEDEAILTREGEMPTPQEVTACYNQWAFEAALINASNVSFRIDCDAFGQAQARQSTTTIGTGIGAAIKRLCFLARELGVYYDLAYEAALPGMAPVLTLLLYGPQEVTGAPQQYGLRLARLCRLLLGYGVKEQGRARKGHTAAFSAAIIEASATVHFLQRTYTFIMDAALLQVLEAPSQPDMSHTQEVAVFDSSIEQAFAEAFEALARSQAVDGWQLEREPEPLLLANSIFIPDFAFTRSSRRIYVEILGFWTPAYRESKLHNLLQLQERDDLLLAIPVEAKDAYASIASSFPIVYYDGQLSATEVLAVLHREYDDFAERLAGIDVTAVWKQVQEEQLLPERTCYALLHCYRRSELQQAAAIIVNDEVAFTAGIGLYRRNWLEQIKQEVVDWLEQQGVLSLRDVLQEMRSRWSILTSCEDATLETCLSLWSDALVIDRTSIFDATIATLSYSFLAHPQDATMLVDGQEPKKVVREKRGSLKKRVSKERVTVQEDLWG